MLCFFFVCFWSFDYVPVIRFNKPAKWTGRDRHKIYVYRCCWLFFSLRSSERAPTPTTPFIENKGRSSKNSAPVCNERKKNNEKIYIYKNIVYVVCAPYAVYCTQLLVFRLYCNSTSSYFSVYFCSSVVF